MGQQAAKQRNFIHAFEKCKWHGRLCAQFPTLCCSGPLERVKKIHFQYKWDNYDFGLNSEHFGTLLGETLEDMDHTAITRDLWIMFSKPAVKDLSIGDYEKR
jgi:hypothetical protein